MERLGNYLRQNLPELQTLVENKLNVKLGKIEIKPIPCCVNDIADYMAKKEEFSPAVMRVATALVRIAIFLTEDGYFLRGSGMIAKAGPSTIYYSRSPLALYGLTDSDMMATELHELTHIAHAKLADITLMEKPPKYTEAFAEYVAMKIMEEKGKTVPESSYAKELFKFRLELDKKKLKTIDQVIQFVLEQKQETY